MGEERDRGWRGEWNGMDVWEEKEIDGEGKELAPLVSSCSSDGNFLYWQYERSVVR